jgi:hypothetical protein
MTCEFATISAAELDDIGGAGLLGASFKALQILSVLSGDPVGPPSRPDGPPAIVRPLTGQGGGNPGGWSMSGTATGRFGN